MHRESLFTMSTTTAISRDRRLVWANVALLLAVLVHDVDHARQMAVQCFTLSNLLITITLLGFVPGLVALTLAWRGHRWAARLTLGFGLLITAIAVGVHMLGGGPFFEYYAVSYFQLPVDGWSWAALWLVAAVAVATAGVAMRSMQHQRPGAQR